MKKVLLTVNKFIGYSLFDSLLILFMDIIIIIITDHVYVCVINILSSILTLVMFTGQDGREPVLYLPRVSE